MGAKTSFIRAFLLGESRLRLRGRLSVEDAGESIEHLYRLLSRKERNLRLSAECRHNDVAAVVSWRGGEVRFDGHLRPRAGGIDLVGRIATPKWQVLLLPILMLVILWWEDQGLAEMISVLPIVVAFSLLTVHGISHGPRQTLVRVLRHAINEPVPRASDPATSE